MPDVKSPYNFVPAPTEIEVYKPDWAHQVSHNIPFSDGQSGEITLKITAETPIFIRNGHAKPKDGEEVTSEFSHVLVNGQKQYFIPATSIKGMLRNVLEIMSFSRMKQVDDHLHSVRQIMGGDEGYTLNGKKEKIKAGYLVKNNGKFYIYPSGVPKKIRYTELDKKFQNEFGKTFEQKVSSNFEERTGAYKYEKIIKDKALEYQFEDLILEDKQTSWVSKFQPLPYVKFSESGEGFWGRIVCVGQATAYKEKQGRKGEYVFPGKRNEIVQKKETRIEVSEKIMNAFLLLNRDGQKTHELKDWRYWKSRTQEGIPVFYRTSEKDPNLLIDFGLTLMYKELVQYSTKSILDYTDEDLDLAETLFGKASKTHSLRGRVMISHFKAIGHCEPMKVQSFALSSPKSSFYPFYLQQKGSNGKTIKFSTYNGDNPRLRGFKRYPVHMESKNQDTSGIKDSQISKFQPLPKLTQFEGKIRFHNLRAIELGALISSITFHGMESAFHSLGSLKPFGYGKIKFSISNPDVWNQYLKEFEIHMKIHNHSRWTSIMKELGTIGHVQSAYEETVSYMPLENFQKVKENKNFLEKYSELVNSELIVPSFSSKEDVEKRVQILAKQKQDKLDVFNSTLLSAEKFIDEDRFEEANNKLLQCKKLDFKFDLDQYQERLKKAQSLKLIFETIIQSEDRNVLEKSKIEFIGTKWEAIIAKKVKQLIDESKALKIDQFQNQDLALDDSGFPNIKNVLNKPFKVKGFEYSDEQKTNIESVLTQNFNSEKNNAKSEWFKQKSNFDKYPWTDVKKWLGEERANALYQKLINS